MGTKATHLLVLFQPPGPPDSAAELKDLMPFLAKNNKLRLTKNCKVKAAIETMESATDFALLQMTMVGWLSDEGEDVEKFAIESVGINVHDSRFEFFQAAWAMPLKHWWQFWK